MTQPDKAELNLRILEARFPHIKSALKGRKSKKLQVRKFKSRSGLTSLEVEKDGKWNALHSRLDPEKESELFIEKKLEEDNTDLVIVVGLGYGYHIRKILKKIPGINILIIEPIPEILESVIESDEILNLIINHNVNIYLAKSLIPVTMSIQGNVFKKIDLVILPSYARLFPEIIENIKSEFAAFIEKERINRATLKRFDRLWTKNILRNSFIYFTKPGVKILENRFKDYPALVVCGGPSAEKSFNLISKFSEKLCIIAVDTAALPMIKKGLYPDFIVSVDPQYINSVGLRYSIEKLNNLKGKNAKNKPFLILDPGVYPTTALSYNGPIFICSSVFPPGSLIEQFVEKKGYLAAGGSVSVSAFDLARILGCNPIIITGLDLAYKKIKTHLSGSLIESYIIKQQTRINPYLSFITRYILSGGSIKIKCENGITLHTDRRLLLYKNWFEKNIKNEKRELINLSEGIPINGFKQPGNKALIEWFIRNTRSEKSKNKEKTKNQILAQFLSFKTNPEVHIKFKEFLLRALTNVEKIIKIATLALETLERIPDSEEETIKTIKILEEYDKIILSHEIENRLISMVMQNPIGHILEKKVDAQNWQNNSKFLYSSIVEGGKYLRIILKKSLKSLDRLKFQVHNTENLKWVAL